MVAKYTAVSTTVRPIEDSSTDEVELWQNVETVDETKLSIQKIFWQPEVSAKAK